MAENYKVLKIDELMKVSDVGAIERYYRHQIKTKGGIVLTIDIPEKDFVADKAAPILDRKAVNADKILAL